MPLSNMAYRTGVRVMWRVTSERRRVCRNSVMSIPFLLVRDCGLHRSKRIQSRLSSFISDVSHAIRSVQNHCAPPLRKLLLFGPRDIRFLYLFTSYANFYNILSSRNTMNIAFEISFIPPTYPYNIYHAFWGYFTKMYADTWLRLNRDIYTCNFILEMLVKVTMIFQVRWL